MIVKTIKTNEILTLNEFCEICDELMPVLKVEDYNEIMQPLVALANNKRLLIDFLQENLEDLDSYQKDNNYNIQSISLARRENYDIRMNFWPSKNDYDLDKGHVKDFFAYDFAHDHNFHFITTSFTDHGYFTDIYSYKYREFELEEEVNIEKVGRFELDRGKIMIYEASKDIHTQFPPQTMAISLNVIPKQKNTHTQYAFDIENRKIKGIVEQGSPYRSLSYILNEVGDKELIDNLEKKLK